MMQSRNQNTPVVFAIDSHFIPYFTTSLTSLLSNNSALFSEIYVVTNFASNRKLNKSLDFFKEKFGKEITTINIDDSEISKLKISKKDHVSNMTYARLLFSEILPEKILYLDSDVIILGSLEELCNITFKDEYLMAVNEAEWKKNSTPKSLIKNNLIGHGYFNAGVMLINLKLWREKAVTDKLIQIAILNHNELRYWDQDVLNIAFRDSWSSLNRKYNAFELTTKVNPQPAIVHFTGNLKPWHILSAHPYKKKYLEYQKMTPFRARLSFGISLYSSVGQILSRNVYTNKIVMLKKKFIP